MSLVHFAFADESGERAEARRHFQRGARLIRVGAYEQAASEFSEAYRLYPNERLHYDIAQAERLAGHREQAVAHYRRYLASVSTGELADDARAQLAALGAPVTREPEPAKVDASPSNEDESSPPGTLSASIDPNAARAPEPPTLEPPKKSDAEPSKANETPSPSTISPSATSSAPLSLPSSPSPPSRRPLYKTWWVWTAAGAAVAVGVGVGLGVGLGEQPHGPAVTIGRVTF